MKGLFYAWLFVLLFALNCNAAILVQSPLKGDFTDVTARGLATVATSADTLGKKIIVTTPITLTTPVTITGRQFEVVGTGKVLYSGSGNLIFGTGSIGKVTPHIWGAVGDNSTDDTTAFKNMFATGLPWEIPSTPNGYKISDTLTIKSNGTCYGTLNAVTGYNKLLVEVTGGWYGDRKVTGLKLSGSGNTPGSVGLYVGTAGVEIDTCVVTGFDYGIQGSSWNLTFRNCHSAINNTNLSLFAPDHNHELNNIKIIGGSYDSAIGYSARIGDPRLSTGYPSSDPLGSSVLIQGASFDGGIMTVDRIMLTTIANCYFEFITNRPEQLILLGGGSADHTKNVDITNCYFNGANYAIKVLNGVKNLTVNHNQSASILYSNLYLTSLLTMNQVNYGDQTSTGSFAGPEVHTGYNQFDSGNSVVFDTISIASQNLVRGVQTAVRTTDFASYYANAKTLGGYKNVASDAYRFYVTPTTGIAGTMSGYEFTCSTIADALHFNGGDKLIGTGAASTAGFVASVDYATGKITVNASGSGAATLSQTSVYWVGEGLSGYGSPEGVVTANIGSTYSSVAGGTTTTLYVKTSGTGNTGWTAK